MRRTCGRYGKHHRCNDQESDGRRGKPLFHDWQRSQIGRGVPRNTGGDPIGNPVRGLLGLFPQVADVIPFSVPAPLSSVR